MIPPAQSAPGSEVAGLHVIDLSQCQEFLSRNKRREGAAERQMEELQRLAQAFVLRPESILKQLTDTAVDLCEADSAGITLQTRTITGDPSLQWVAVSGMLARYSSASFPYVTMACGAGIERARPQLFRMGQKLFERLGIQAEPATDGLLIPWRTGTLRGTVWIMAHGREEAFDADDVRVMEMLASFAAMAFRQQRQQKMVVEQASQAAAAAMANELAHGINNPLQSLTNLAYLASQEDSPLGHREMAEQMAADLERLSTLVRSLLALPMRRQQFARAADSTAATAA